MANSVSSLESQLDALINSLEPLSDEPTASQMQDIFSSHVWTGFQEIYAFELTNDETPLALQVIDSLCLRFEEMEVPPFISEMLAQRETLLQSAAQNPLQCVKAVQWINALLQWGRARDTLMVWYRLKQAMGSNGNVSLLASCHSIAETVQRAQCFPQWMEKHREGLQTIAELNLSDLQLHTLPDCLSRLTETLSLRRNALTKLPDLSLPSKLEILDISHNCLSAAPSSLSQLHNLKHLFLDHNSIAELPDLSQLAHLERCALSYNELTAFPEALLQLPNLKSLFLEHNDIAALPALPEQSTLETLDLAYNHSSDVPASLCNLSGLQVLNLSGNGVKRLPDMSMLSNLTKLLLVNNELDALPNLPPNLQDLNVSGNLLATLPDSVSQLSHLAFLDLSDNRLEALPSSIVQLPHLLLINCRRNKLTHLPLSIIAIPKNCWIRTAGNPLADENAFLLTYALSRRGSLAPRIEDLLPSREVQLETNDLEQLLAEWAMFFAGAFPKNEYAALWDARAQHRPHTTDPSDPAFGAFYRPLLEIENAQDRDNLAKFLRGIRGTKRRLPIEDFRQLSTLPNVILKIDRMLEGAAINDVFREKMLATVHEAIDGCHDRYTWGLNHIEILWHVHCDPEIQKSDVALAQMLIGSKRLNVLDEYAKSRANAIGQVDPLELVLYEQLQLKNRLALPLSTMGMLYDGEPKQHITQEMLEQDAESVLEQTSTVDQIVDCLADPEAPGYEVWADRIKAKHPTLFEEIEESITIEMDEAADRDIPMQQYANETKRLGDERTQWIQARVRNLTKAWVHEHYNVLYTQEN